MQANINYAKSATVLSSIALVMILILGFANLAQFTSVREGTLTEEDITALVGAELAELEFPEYPEISEESITEAILAGMDFPEYEEVDMSKVNNVWNQMFGEQLCTDNLEAEALDAVIAEFDSDYVVGLYEVSIFEIVGNFELDDEETEFSLFNWFEGDEGNFPCTLDKYVSFSFEEFDDTVIVTLTYNFDVRKVDGVTPNEDTYARILTVTGEYTYDIDDEEATASITADSTGYEITFPSI